VVEPHQQPLRLVRTWIVAILALVGGGLLCCGALTGFVGLAMMPMQQQVMATMPSDPAVQAQLALQDELLPWQVLGLVLQTLASAGLIAGGVGLILRRRWGRTLGLLGGGLALAYLAVSAFATARTFDAMFEAMPPDPNVPPEAFRMGMVIGAVAAGGCFAGIPIVCMILLLTPAVSAEIKAWESWRRAADAF